MILTNEKSAPLVTGLPIGDVFQNRKQNKRF